MANQSNPTPEAGQIWRHRYYDHDPKFAEHRHATVRLISKNEKGGWLVRKLTDSRGRDATHMRNVRIKEWNLIDGYELVEPKAKVVA